MRRDPSRAVDERLLQMVLLRAQGCTVRHIGARYGIAPGRVSLLTNEVRAADLTESGEPSATVAPAYWPVKDSGGRHAG